MDDRTTAGRRGGASETLDVIATYAWILRMNADASEEEVTATATRRSGLATGVLVFAFSLHLMAGYLVLISGLIFPIPAVLGLLALWFVGLYLMVRWRARPGWVLAVPLSLGVIWFATGWVGDTFLGWTA